MVANSEKASQRTESHKKSSRIVAEMQRQIVVTSEDRVAKQRIGCHNDNSGGTHNDN